MKNKELAEIIDELRKDTVSALIGPRANIKDVMAVFQNLKHQPDFQLPKDYIDFISGIANGFSYDSRVFFGITPLYDPEIDYTIPDIRSYNRRHQDHPGLENKLLIGHADEDFYCFNGIENTYEILDRIDGMVYESFSTFEELFTYEVH